MGPSGKKQLFLGCGKNSSQSHIQDSCGHLSFTASLMHVCNTGALGLSSLPLPFHPFTSSNALQLPQDNNNFTSPPNANTIISFVNELGYPNVVRTLSRVVTNDMYQPWRALATIINLCLTRKTSAFERPRAPVLQILWGVVNKANIDYAERIWEEFTQCIHSFIEDKMNLALHTEGKKKVNPLVIPGIRFTKLIINHLQSIHKFHKRLGSPLHLPFEESALGYLKFLFKNTKRVRFGMAIPDTLISEDIRSAPYFSEHVAKVTKSQRYLAGEVVSDDEAPAPKPAKGAKPKTPRKPKPQSTSSQLPKPKPAPAKPQEKKRKLVMDTTEAPSPAKRSKAGKVVKKRTFKSSQQLVDEFVDEGVPADEPRFKDEEADIMQKVMEESLKDAYPAPRGPLPPVVIREPEPRKFQPLLERRTPATAEPSGLVETSSLYAELGLTDSETDSNEEENLKLPTEGDVRLEEPASFAATLSSLQNLNKEINFTNQFLAEKSQEDKPEKTNTKAEVQSLVTVPIHQDTLSVPIMTTPVIDLTVSQPAFTMVDANQALEERLDKQGNRIHQLETQDLSRMIREQTVEYIDKQEIDRKIKETVKEAVTALVQYAIRAPLRARFKDLPTSDMKEIMLQHMLKENYDKGHEDHQMAYEALQKSILRDESEQFDAVKTKERKKMKSNQDSSETLPRSPPPPPPPPPLSGASGDSDTTEAFDST
ncbi:hypothetical protein Tco_1047351 [Tanacetum coccineum]